MSIAQTPDALWTIYSATSILEKCRKVVLEKWFFKLGFFFLVNHFSRTRKNLDLWYKTTFFSGQPLFSNQISQTRFLEPLFYTFLEKWLQIKWSTGNLLLKLTDQISYTVQQLSNLTQSLQSLTSF